MFENWKDLKEYADREIQEVLPAGWRTQLRVREDRLVQAGVTLQPDDYEWKLSLSEGSSTLISSYLIRVSNDLKYVYLLFGNSDAGSGSKCLDLAVTGKIFESKFLKHCSLSVLLKALMETCRPNLEGVV